MRPNSVSSACSSRSPLIDLTGNLHSAATAPTVPFVAICSSSLLPRHLDHAMHGRYTHRLGGLFLPLLGRTSRSPASIHPSAWRNCLKTLDISKPEALRTGEMGQRGLFLPCCATKTHAQEPTERLFRQSLEDEFSEVQVIPRAGETLDTRYSKM